MNNYCLTSLNNLSFSFSISFTPPSSLPSSFSTLVSFFFLLSPLPFLPHLLMLTLALKALCTLSCILLQSNTHIPQLPELWLPLTVPRLPCPDSCWLSHPQLNSTFLFRDRLKDKFRSTLFCTQGNAEATSNKALKKWGRSVSA